MTAVLGLGTDLVELPRFAVFLRRHEDGIGEVFTSAELDLAGRSGQREVYLATRWALKEAVLKAVGTGWGRGAEWTEVEVVGRLLAPRIVLHGTVAELAEELGVCQAAGSVAFAGGQALAIAVLSGEGT